MIMKAHEQLSWWVSGDIDAGHLCLALGFSGIDSAAAQHRTIIACVPSIQDDFVHRLIVECALLT